MVSCVKCKKRDSALRDKSLIASPRLCDRHLSLISARGSQSKDFSSQNLESHSGFDKTAEIDKQLTSKSNLPQNERSEVSLENFQNLQSPTAKPATAVQGEAEAGFFRIPRILEEESRASLRVDLSTKQSNSAQAESNQINGARKACNLESVVGGLGGERGDKGGDFAIQAPPSPLERTLSQAKLESSHTAQKVDSSMDCHALPCKARNDRKLDSANTAILSEPAKDSRICDEKSGLSSDWQGRALGVRNRPEQPEIADLSRKAESISKKPTPPTNQAAGGRIFDEKVELCSGEQGDKTCGLSTQRDANSPLFRKKPTPTTIAIIGLGYVGLPLTLTFGAKYPTIGFDINATRVKELQEKLDSSGECELQDFLQAPLARFSSEPSELAQATIYLIAVPTPITKDKLPDLSYLQSACDLVGSMLKVGDIVVFESTTYPTCTRNFCVPLLESTSKLQLNRDFCVGYSPERINPADKTHSLSQIVKITSGSSKESAEIIDRLYASVIPAGTHCVSSIEIAEASKALENAQRDVNIAFMNEAYMLFDTLGLDMAEILQAARTKWNFLPFYPGLVGGHCISVDPYYLSYIAKLQGFSPTLLTKARIVNEAMPSFIASKFAKQLESAGIELQGARVLVVGFAFKKDCKDMRNTKVPHLCYELESLGLEVEVLDSLIDRDRAKLEYGISVLESKQLLAASDDSGYDGVLCNVLHTCDAHIDLASLCKPCSALVFVSP